MSTKISKKRFREVLRTLIRQEIEEASTTASAGIDGTGTGHYDTPKAFSTGSGHPTDGEVGGLKKVDEVKFAVTVDMGSLGDGHVLVDAGSKGQAKTMVAKKLKQGMKGVKDIKRVQPALGKQVDKKLENVNEGRYHDWRNDESLTPKQKIGKSIREVRNSLNELDKTIKMNLRLKNELNVDSRTYWKNTHKALNSISERLVKLASKVGNLK